MSEPKKVLLVYGDVGGGHASAARALKEAFALVYGERFEVVAVDLFQVADPAPWGDSNASFQAVSRTAFSRALNDWFNSVTDVGLGYQLLRRLILYRTLRPYQTFFSKQSADLIVSLHPYTTITIAALRQQGLATPCAVVVTDLVSIVRGWADPQAALTISPSEEASRKLRDLGVSAERIRTPLFPIRSSLRDIAPKDEVFARHQLNPNSKTVVVTGGGVATGALAGIIAQIVRYNVQIIIICGKDQAIAQKLRRDYQDNTAVVVLGFVQDMQNYLAHADLVISKAGPASILEIDLLGVPAILSHEVGSQEKGNAAYAMQSPRFRFLAGREGKLPDYLEELLNLPPGHPPSTRRSFDESLEIVQHLAGLLE